MSRAINAFTLWMIFFCSSVFVYADKPRQWSDTTGKFKVTATFLEKKGNSVILEKEDGKKLTIPIAKLSDADKAFLEGMEAANPFAEMSEEDEAASDSSSENDSDKGSNGNAKPSRKSSRAIDWSEAETIEILGGDRWEIPLPAQPGLAFEPKKVPLPKKGHFFEGMQPMAINMSAKKVALGYLTGFSIPTPIARLVIGDLETGKMVSSETVEANMKPLCLLNDGATVLMVGYDEKGEGADAVQAWKLKGKKIERGDLWVPFEADLGNKDDRRGGERHEREAAYVSFAVPLAGDLVLMCSRKGHLACVDISQRVPKWHVALGDVPAVNFTADNSLMTFVHSNQIIVMKTDNGEIVGQISVQDKGHIPWPKVAFSPSGKKLAMASWERVFVLDVETKEWIQEISFPGTNVGNTFAFPDEEYVLFDNRVLIHYPTRIQLWTLQDVHVAQVVGDYAFLGCNTDAGGLLMPTKLPTTKALSTLSAAQKQSDLFVVKPGAQIGVNVNGVPQQYQEQVKAGLEKAIERIGCKVNQGAEVQLVAAVTGPKQEAVSYHMSGSHVVQSYVSKIAVQYRGQDAWGTSGTNIPGMVMLSRDETMESYLAKASSSPNLKIFEQVVLPEYLQKPAPPAGPNAQPQPFNTIGASKLTANGLQ